MGARRGVHLGAGLSTGAGRFMMRQALNPGDASLGGPKRQRGPIQGGKRPTAFSPVGSLSSLAERRSTVPDVPNWPSASSPPFHSGSNSTLRPVFAPSCSRSTVTSRWAGSGPPGAIESPPAERVNDSSASRLSALPLIVTAVSHYRIDRPTAGGRTAKQLQ